MKLCSECKFAELVKATTGEDLSRCLHPMVAPQKVEPVWGKEERPAVYCSVARATAPCGPEAVLFDALPAGATAKVRTLGEPLTGSTLAKAKP